MLSLVTKVKITSDTRPLQDPILTPKLSYLIPCVTCEVPANRHPLQSSVSYTINESYYSNT